MTDESLWPARAVAEYAYCPRLFYYTQVEGITLPNRDTELGKAVHRRVDQPSSQAPDIPPDPESPVIARSLTLSSQPLGLIAVLDLAELTGLKAVPVEYRKGRPRRVATESSENLPLPWPVDLVQLGLQVILLESAGYEVSEAVLYYAEEKLRLTIPTDDALKSEALQTLEAAQKCSLGPRPLPLHNDPRCPRCSLQPVCLPDEIHHERQTAAEINPRKLWPPQDGGLQVVAQQDGLKVGVRGLELYVSGKSGAAEKTIPLVNLESLSLLGPVQISTQALQVLADRRVPIAFLSQAGRLVAMVDPLDSVSAVVRRSQVRQFDREDKCLELARALISSKIINQRTLLIRNHHDLPAEAAGAMAQEARQAATATSLDTLRGHEGRAAAIYFGHFSGMLSGPLAAEFKAHGRKRRPPPDPINACLSLAYSMLTHECVAALRLASLEPSIGGFHVSRPGRPALALDLMEPFRPLVSDSIALSCFNRNELTEGHFIRTAAGCALTEAGRRSFFNALGRRMDTIITHQAFGYRLSYRRMIMLHAKMIAAWLVGDIATLTFLTTR